MQILGLDLGTKTGWAYSDADSPEPVGTAGTWDLAIKRDESGGMRLLRLSSKLQQVHSMVGVQLVVFEAARNAAPKMQGALVRMAEFQAVVKLWCHSNGVEYRGYSPAEIKKHATGKGNANKQAMIAAARARFGGEYTDDNMVDALWVLDLAINDLSLSPLKGVIAK